MTFWEELSGDITTLQDVCSKWGPRMDELADDVERRRQAIDIMNEAKMDPKSAEMQEAALCYLALMHFGNTVNYYFENGQKVYGEAGVQFCRTTRIDSD